LVYQHPQEWTEDLIEIRTSEMIDRLLAIWSCPPDAAQPAGTQTETAPVPETQLEDDAFLSWSPGEEDVELAARMWVALSPAARRLMQILMQVAPQRVAAPDLAHRLDLKAGAQGVAGHLSRVSTLAAQLGRRTPVDWAEGDPSSYSLQEAVAATFEAAMQLAASEEFVASAVRGDPMDGQPPPPGHLKSGRRSVPKHVIEVFAAHPDDVELTVREIAAAKSTQYAADEISQGAIAAALTRGGIEGIEVVPHSTPLRARRRRW
jgi:hypothetical protein